MHSSAVSNDPSSRNGEAHAQPRSHDGEQLEGLPSFFLTDNAGGITSFTALEDEEGDDGVEEDNLDDILQHDLRDAYLNQDNMGIDDGEDDYYNDRAPPPGFFPHHYPEQRPAQQLKRGEHANPSEGSDMGMPSWTSTTSHSGAYGNSRFFPFGDTK
tara:strand:- start:296 stop:766 length:471 start_codon:yes stop_codon:yes gene_type:complete